MHSPYTKDEIMNHSVLMIPAIVSFISVSIIEAADSTNVEEREAMEIGGVVTTDLYGAADNLKDATFEIGTVELGANVNLSKSFVASVVVKAEGNLHNLFIDKAVGQYHLNDGPLTYLFGVYTQNHGLLTTHLISDPSIVANEDFDGAVEINNPALSLNLELKKFSLGAALTVLNFEIDSITKSNNYAGLLNFDVPFMDESLFRLSSILSQEFVDVDLAAEIIFSGLSADLEVYSRFSYESDDQSLSGYFAGLAYSFANDHLEIAARYDGTSTDFFNELDHRIGAGFTVNIIDGIFIATEYSYTRTSDGEHSQELAFEVGFENTLKLPGFQRKTLTQNRSN
jgi:hypothetical protein